MCNAAGVAKVITGVTGVVVSLGGKTKDVGKTMLTDGTLNVINAMKSANVQRVAVVRPSAPATPPSGAARVPHPHEHGDAFIFTDKNNQEQLFLGPGGPGRDLEYCIVRPGGLGTGPPTGVINVIDGEAGSIADVADFCLGALFESAFPYIRRRPAFLRRGHVLGQGPGRQGHDGGVSVRESRVRRGKCGNKK